MLIAVCLLILAVLLFGSTRVLGAAGAMLGGAAAFIAAASAVAYFWPSISAATGITDDNLFPAALLAVAGFGAVCRLAIYVMDRSHKNR